MRLSTELLLLGIVGALADWAAHAPAGARARADYFCAPVIAAARLANRLQAALDDGGQVIPPSSDWHFEPQRDCARAVVQLSREEQP